MKTLGLIALLAIGVLACDLLATTSAQTKTIVAADKQSQIDVPPDWSLLEDLNDKAELQVGNRGKEVYLIILTENKADLANMNLEKHSQLTLGKLLGNTAASTKPEGATSTIDGHRAIQSKVEATVDHLNVVYLHTDIEGAVN